MRKQQSNKKRKRGWLIPVVILLLLCIAGSAALISDAPSRRELETLVIEDVDFSQLQDGTYVGTFEGTQGSLRNATVEVTVSGGALSGCRILSGAIDDNGDPTELTDGQTILDLFSRVQAAQSLQVDVISGATLTSKAHLKALEQALEQAQPSNP